MFKASQEAAGHQHEDIIKGENMAKEGKDYLKKKGYVYIIKNDAWSDWCKIGQTTNSIEKRLYQYQTGTPFRDYYSVFTLHTEHVSELEYNVHKRLEEEGYCKNSEWFQIPEHKAIELITEEYLKQ